MRVRSVWQCCQTNWVLTSEFREKSGTSEWKMEIRHKDNLPETDSATTLWTSRIYKIIRTRETVAEKTESGNSWYTMKETSYDFMKTFTKNMTQFWIQYPSCS